MLFSSGYYFLRKILMTMYRLNIKIILSLIKKHLISEIILNYISFKQYYYFITMLFRNSNKYINIQYII